MSTTNYFVDSHDDSTIVLRQQMLRFVKVTIPRSSIASVRQGVGFTTIETTGHRSYRVMQGILKAQRDRTDAAFAHRPNPV